MLDAQKGGGGKSPMYYTVGRTIHTDRNARRRQKVAMHTIFSCRIGTLLHAPAGIHPHNHTDSCTLAGRQKTLAGRKKTLSAQKPSKSAQNDANYQVRLRTSMAAR